MPTKILHFGKNVANNPYANVKYLSQASPEGYQYTVLSYNNKHGMAKPEWDEISSTPPKNIFNERWLIAEAKKNGFVRPEWFVEKNSLLYSSITGKPKRFSVRKWIEDTKDFFINKLVALGITKSASHRRIPGTARGKITALCLLPFGAGLYTLSKLLNGLEARVSYYFLLNHTEKERLRIIRREASLTLSELYPLIPSYCTIRHWLKGYDIVQVYSTDSIYAYLALPPKSYIAYDNGPLRDVRTYPTVLNRLLEQAYKNAAHVFITNPDTIEQVEEIKLPRYSYVPHIVDANRFTPGDKKPDRDPLYKNKFLVLAPARQNWDIKGNDILLSGFAKFAQGKDDVYMLMAEWGQHVENTRGFINSHQLNDKVGFYQAALKNVFINYLRQCDVVADQFIVRTFGGIVPEALACGKPVITSFDSEMHEWCFDTQPPILAASSSKQVHIHLEEIYADKTTYQNLSKLSRNWAKNSYSVQQVAEEHLTIYKNFFLAENKNTDYIRS